MREQSLRIADDIYWKWVYDEMVAKNKRGARDVGSDLAAAGDGGTGVDDDTGGDGDQHAIVNILMTDIEYKMVDLFPKHADIIREKSNDLDWVVEFLNTCANVDLSDLLKNVEDVGALDAEYNKIKRITQFLYRPR